MAGKTKYIVFVKNKQGDFDIQTVLPTREDAEYYAKQYSRYQEQYIASMRVLSIIRK